VKQPSREKLAEQDGQYLIRTQTPEEAKRNDNSEDTPAYKVRLSLSKEQQDRLVNQFKEEFDALLAERSQLGLTSKWKEKDNQYDGILRANSKLAFNLHTHQSKIKSNAIVRALNEAFLDSDPIVDVTPRPSELKREAKTEDEVCERQQQFVEFAMDEEIKPEHDISQTNICAVNKFVGIIKLEYLYEKETRRREEVYEGKNEVKGTDPQGNPIIENEALKEFEANYPNWEERGYASYRNRIADGKKVSLVVEYLDTISNNPKFTNVPIENFFVKNSTNGYAGLCKAHLIGELQKLTWYELKKKEKEDEFINVDKIKDMPLNGDEKAGGETKETYRTRDYDIIEATTYFAMNEDDDEIKVKVWFAPKSEEMHEFIFLGAINYPWYGYDSDYVPFYVKLNNDGFYGGCKSVLDDLKDSNIAQDAILNLSLHSMYVRNILTPIVKEGSDLETLFLENRWTDGKPLAVDALTEDVKDAMAFVQYPQINLQDFVVLGQQLKKIDGDVTGVSDLMTGRESPTDPRAPASKTIALLNQSGVNIKDYIRCYLPSFNTLVGMVLQLYYQMNQGGKKFKVGIKSQEVTGAEIFNTITRDQMVARTNIQARAASFAFDKINEKSENLAAMNMVATSPVASMQPELYYKALKITLKSWNSTWKNFAETDLMSPEQFSQKQMQTAMQAVAMYFEKMKQNEQVTGVAQPPNMQDIAQQVTGAQAAAANPKVAEMQAKQEGK
jgi:hypothetical protein